MRRRTAGRRRGLHDRCRRAPRGGRAPRRGARSRSSSPEGDDDRGLGLRRDRVREGGACDAAPRRGRRSPACSLPPRGTDELPLQGHDGADRARPARHARAEARRRHGHRRGRLQRLRAGVRRQHRGRAHCDAQPGREARGLGDAARRAAVVPCDERHDQGGGGSPPRDDGRRLEPLLAQPPRLVPARRPAPRLAGRAGDGDAPAHHADGARDRHRAGPEAEGRGVRRGRRDGGQAVLGPPRGARRHGTLPLDARLGRRSPGLRLTATGRLTGTPTAAGRFTFVVRVTDSARTSATRRLVVRIS